MPDIEKLVSSEPHRIEGRATVHLYGFKSTSADVANGPDKAADTSIRVNDDRWPAVSGQVVQ